MKPEYVAILILVVLVAGLVIDRLRHGAKQRDEDAEDVHSAVGVVETTPVRSGDFTPGGHQIMLVKEFDDEFLKNLHPDQRENRVEVYVDVGSHRPPAAFRGKSREAAIANADAALSGRPEVDYDV